MPRAEELLAIVRDFNRSPGDRVAAFSELLGLRSGWWGTGLTLREFAVSRASYFAERRSQAGLPGDLLDAEGIADEALLLLQDPEAVIQGEPAGWLVGVIKILLAGGLRRESIHIRSISLDDPNVRTVPPSTRADHGTERSTEEIAAAWTLGRALVTALREMPPGRRRTAEHVLRAILAHYLEKRRFVGFALLGETLGKSGDAVRQDWQRARKQIEASVRHAAPHLLRMLGPIGRRFKRLQDRSSVQGRPGDG
ncbi:MAG TPA: hypothetical protein VLT84_08165 [Acidobacteriota bacterium]|nr:hypothetical protein [Acidobacteriota bacterium]